MMLTKSILRIPLFLAMLLLVAAAITFSAFHQTAANAEPWTDAQLMTPAALQERLIDKSNPAPLVLSIGPGAVIKGSEDIGAAHEDAGLTKLKARLATLPREKELVIYCGCCPFEHCPNIRPAFTLLNEMKFSHARLLNIEHNIKTDWISKGYLTTP